MLSCYWAPSQKKIKLETIHFGAYLKQKLEKNYNMVKIDIK